MARFDLNRRQLIIINSLYNKGNLTAMDLSLILNVSVRTVKSDIRELKMKFKDSELKILSKPGKGYGIKIKDKELREYLESLNTSNSIRQINEFYNNNYERIFYIIRRLLTAHDFIKLESLADEVFVARSTVNQDMKEVKRLLSQYDLKIISKPNYGIMLEGTESNKRLCMAEYLFHNKVGLKNPYINDRFAFAKNEYSKLKIIERVLREVCQEEKINLSDFSYKNISIHILITILRNDLGFNVTISDAFMTRIQSNEIYKATQKICTKLEKELNFVFKEEEIAYIFMHIDSKQIIYDFKDDDMIETEIVLDDIFKEIKNNFDIDISKDITLRKYLLLHIPQMIKRIKNHLVVRNPIIHENLRKYLYATKVTISAAAILESHYNVNIGLDEFGYLVFYFNMALSNIKKEKVIKIGFISAKGRSESIMYQNELNENFPPPKYKITTYDSINSPLLDPKDIDILVSTNYVESDKCKLKVSIEEGNYIEKIKEYSRKMDLYNLNLDKYFNEKYMLFNLKGKSRQEILSNIYNALIEMDIAHKKNVNAEPFVSHEMGNGIVHLQDLYKLCHKSVCLIAVLENPILWEKSLINVLFLIKTKRDGDKDLFILCDLFSKWASDKEKVTKLFNNKSYKAFMTDILDY